MDKIQILADTYPLGDMLEQNDVEEYAVVKWLVDEGHVNLNDYFYEDELIVGEDD
jgi:hypothetical protein